MELVIQLVHPYHMTGVQSESIPLEKVVSVEIVSGPFWLRWLGVEKLALTVQRAERPVGGQVSFGRGRMQSAVQQRSERHRTEPAGRLPQQRATRDLAIEAFFKLHRTNPW